MFARAALALMTNRHLLVMTLLVVTAAGLSSFGSLPRTEDPRITMRNPLVVTRLPGADAERVESLVTEKLEEALQEVPEIVDIDSTSRAGVSIVSVELAGEVTESETVFSEIRDKLAEAEPRLPREAASPVFDDKRGAVAFSLLVGITAEDETRLGIQSRLAEELADRLRAVPGTEIVRLYGEPEEELTVRIDHEELAALGLTPAAVAAAVRDADTKTPSGVLRGARSDLLLEVEGELDSLARVAAVPLVRAGDGSLVRVGDVATVEKGWREPPAEVALVDGRRAVYVAARMEADERADAWAVGAQAVVDDFRSEVGGSLAVDVVFDQSLYTTARLRELGSNLLAGAVVVVLVVLFTMGLRSGLVVGAALPLTTAVALFLLMGAGGTLQQMSIFGMMIALGLLIDNAIVIVDEVGSRLHAGEPREHAVRGAVEHLFRPLLASTLTTVLAFAPIPLLIGNVGDFVGPIGVSVILALAASFVLAMTLIPALAGFFVRTHAERRWWRNGLDVPPLARGFRRFLHFGLRRPAVALAIACALPVLGFALAPTLGNQFFPRVDRNMFDVQIWLPPEASLDHTRRVAEAAEAKLREHPEVKRVSWLVGGSFPSVYYNLVMSRDDASNYARGAVETATAEEVKRLLPVLQAELDAALPGAQVLVRRFSQGPPVDAEVEFEIRGPSVAVLQDLGEQVRQQLYASPEVLHTQASLERGEPKLWVDVDEDEARLAGLTLRDVAAQLQGNLEGRTGGSVVEQLEELPVRIRFADERRGEVGDVASSQLVAGLAAGRGGPGDGPGGVGGEGAPAWLPLEALGEIALRPEVGGITRCGGVRCNRVQAYTKTGALPIDVTTAVQQGLDASGFTLPAGYTLSLGGDSEEQAVAVAALLRYAPVLFVLMVATVVLSFRSGRLAAMLFGVAGLSVGIGLLATWVSGFPFSFNSILGTAGLIGVALNDSIVVLAAIRENPRAREGRLDAVVDAVLGTGRHVVSTTLTTIGGFLPLLIFVGGDFWPPLAIVLAGGVAGATILATVFVPASYVLLMGRGARAAEAAAPSAPREAAKATEPMGLASTPAR